MTTAALIALPLPGTSSTYSIVEVPHERAPTTWEVRDGDREVAWFWERPSAEAYVRRVEAR